ncbi:hypothetical protein [Actinoplanes sp. NPDC089786]|uniref:hypothetical protein n=1 Tax=Actinoplanes sp. NPDC089786 TaxID=3155185 RepID=UPI00342A95A2
MSKYGVDEPVDAAGQQRPDGRLLQFVDALAVGHQDHVAAFGGGRDAAADHL